MPEEKAEQPRAGTTDTRAARLEFLMHRFGDEVLSLAYFYLKDYHLAEDAAQETFFRAYQRLDTFRGESAVGTWLYRIAVNVCLDYLRRAKRRPLSFLGFGRAEEEENTPESLFLAGEEKRELLKGVLGLPLKYRTVIALRYFHNLTNKEVATVLGLSPANVRVRLFRAHALLRKYLDEGGGGGGGQGSRGTS